MKILLLTLGLVLLQSCDSAKDLDDLHDYVTHDIRPQSTEYVKKESLRHWIDYHALSYQSLGVLSEALKLHLESTRSELPEVLTGEEATARFITEAATFARLTEAKGVVESMDTVLNELEVSCQSRRLFDQAKLHQNMVDSFVMNMGGPESNVTFYVSTDIVESIWTTGMSLFHADEARKIRKKISKIKQTAVRNLISADAAFAISQTTCLSAQAQWKSTHEQSRRTAALALGAWQASWRGHQAQIQILGSKMLPHLLAERLQRDSSYQQLLAQLGTLSLQRAQEQRLLQTTRSLQRVLFQADGPAKRLDAEDLQRSLTAWEDELKFYDVAASDWWAFNPAAFQTYIARTRQQLGGIL